MENIEVLQTISDEDLNVYSVEINLDLRWKQKRISSPELSITYNEENNNARSLKEINNQIESIFKENQIGYKCAYIDPFTLDYHHYILVTKKSKEQIINLFKDIPDIHIGTFYPPNLKDENYNDIKSIVLAKEKLLEILNLKEVKR